MHRGNVKWVKFKEEVELICFAPTCSENDLGEWKAIFLSKTYKWESGKREKEDVRVASNGEEVTSVIR